MQPNDNQPVVNQPNATVNPSIPTSNMTSAAQPIQTTIQAASQEELNANTPNSLTSSSYVNTLNNQEAINEQQNQVQTSIPQENSQIPPQNPVTPPLTTPQNPPSVSNPTPQFNQTPQQTQGQIIQTPQLNQAPQNNPQKPAKKTREQTQQEATAQNSLLISEIRDNMIILNDGTFRAVVACDSINYDLMSSEERDGVEYSYQQFLNTLYFPVQIVIQSRMIDLKPYTDKLERIRAQQENMLLGILMDEYLDFIFDISEQANIMEKNFFVVIPYSLTGEIDSAVNSFKNLSDGMLSSIQKKTSITINAKDYTKVKDEMNNRVNTVVRGLMNMGVRAGQLPTEAINMLYYNFYNPDTALNEPIKNFEAYNGIYTRQGEGDATMPGMEV